MRRILCSILAMIMVLSLICIPITTPVHAKNEFVVEGVCGRNMLWRITSETGLLEIWGIQEMTNYDPTGSPINAHPAPWSYERYIERVKHILIKNGPTSIGDYAFAGLCLTETVSIPNTITNIGSNAFAGLDVIKEIELPTSIKTIGDNAFLGCKAAGSIFIPSEVASIGKNAFPYGVTVSSRNKYYSSDEYGALFDASKETLIRVPITHTGEYIVPSTVKKIAPNAFDGCTAITAVYFGKNLVEIGERAFAKCEKLKGLYFDGNSPKSQDNYANYIGVISTSLPTIYYRKNLKNHMNVQRTYAINGEAGLLVCSWPEGTQRPRIPFVYSDEVWTGIEYQVATCLAYEGYEREAFDIVKAVRERYNGKNRNPFNEVECGNHYARSLASYGLLLAYSGFTFDMTKKQIAFKAKELPYTTFFTTAQGFGLCHIDGNEYRVQMLYGDLNGIEIKIY